MLIGRLLVGFGIGSSLVNVFSILNNNFIGDNAKKITGYCFVSFAIAPGIGTLFGGIIVTYINL